MQAKSLSRLNVLLKVVSVSVLLSLTACAKEVAESQESSDTQAQDQDQAQAHTEVQSTQDTSSKQISTDNQSNITPKQLYQNYLEEVQKTTDIATFPYQTYLSARALAEQQKSMASMGIEIDMSLSVNDKPVKPTEKTVSVNPELKKPGKMAKFFLKMWKASAVMPPNAVGDVVIEGDKATWEFVAKDYPNADDDLTTTVFYVNEGGWKIDTIKSVQASKDGSTTFTSQMF